MKGYMTAADAERLYGVSRQVIWLWRVCKKLEYVKDDGRYYYARPSVRKAVEEFRKKNGSRRRSSAQSDAQEPATCQSA